MSSNDDQRSRGSRPRRQHRDGDKSRPPRAHRQPRAAAGATARPLPPQPKMTAPADQSEIVDERLRFADLNLPEPILRAVADLGYQACTPIQEHVLPKTLGGADATGQAQTGTGKTAAFLITIFTHLLRRTPPAPVALGHPRVLIIAPTRELALQIEKDAHDLGRHCAFHILTLIGGVDYSRQRSRLSREAIDIVIATPGRLLDFRQQHLLDLDAIEILVIDEADRMLDMGFIPDVRRIVYSTPPKERRQTMLFSATMNADVIRLAEQWTKNPVRVEIEPDRVAVKSVEQLVYITTVRDKFALLCNLLKQEGVQSAIIFGNRRDATESLLMRLRQYGIDCRLLSGSVPQKTRMRTLDAFKRGDFRFLVATDVAGRGLHVEGISHVINYNLPHSPEDYVHRIGRTGRAGAQGTSISFACEEDSFALLDIEQFIGHELICTHPSETLLQLPGTADE